MTRQVLAVGIAAIASRSLAPAWPPRRPLTRSSRRTSQAKGGLDKMQAVQTLKQTSHMSMQGMEATLTVLAQAARTSSGRRSSLSGQTIVLAFDGRLAVDGEPVHRHRPAPVRASPDRRPTRSASSRTSTVRSCDYKDEGLASSSSSARRRSARRRCYHLRLTVEDRLRSSTSTSTPRRTSKRSSSATTDGSRAGARRTIGT